MYKEAETRYHFRISSQKAVDRNDRDYNYSITVLIQLFA